MKVLGNGLSGAENVLKKATAGIETQMANGAKKLANVLMPGVNANSIMSGIEKMAKVLAPNPNGAKADGKSSGPKTPDIKRGPGVPKPWIHLPGQKGRPAECVSPHEVIDALFPPLPPSRRNGCCGAPHPSLPCPSCCTQSNIN